MKDLVKDKLFYENYWKNIREPVPHFIARIMKTTEIIRGLGKIDKLLDVGCGEGYLTQNCSKYSRQVFSFDISKNSVKHNRSISNVKLLISDCQFIPFLDNVFDVAVAGEVIEHIKSPDKMLKELYRVIKKNGVLILSTPNRRRIGKILAKLIRKDLDLGWHKREYNIHEIKIELEKNGFKIVSINTDYFGLSIPIKFLNRVFHIGSKKLSKYFPEFSTCFIIKAIKVGN